MAEKDIPGGGNRRIKDSMFVDLFGKDVSAKGNFLSLYNALLEKCVALRQYSQFVALLREAHRTGKRNPLSWAVREAVRKGILLEYLERKSTVFPTKFQGGI
ncbi:MAG: hypothetical protein ILP07_08245 [Treponema sp.]|nr:hypothetical protein [Treponema sp.]